MRRDLDAVLKGWNYEAGTVQARLIKAHDGREVLQLRVELGVLQLETTGRPDGTRPHGHDTMFEYLQVKAAAADADGEKYVPDEDECAAADREFVQFYHRRIAWLALRQFGRAVEDADHTLEFMDFLKEHSPSEDFTLAHEQYRGFVIFHRTQAAAAHHAEAEEPAAAVKAIRDGLRGLRDFFAEHGLEDRMEEDGMVQQLRKLESSLRELHDVEISLEEQLEKAIAEEDYEGAAKLRDQIRARG